MYSFVHFLYATKLTAWGLSVRGVTGGVVLCGAAEHQWTKEGRKCCECGNRIRAGQHTRDSGPTLHHIPRCPTVQESRPPAPSPASQEQRSINVAVSAPGTHMPLRLHQRATWPTPVVTADRVQPPRCLHSNSLASARSLGRVETVGGEARSLLAARRTATAAVLLPGRAAREARLCQRGDRSTAAALTGSGYQQPRSRRLQATAHANG